MRKYFITGLMLLASLVLSLPVLGQLTYMESQPRQVVLPWQNDPSTSMAITCAPIFAETNKTCVLRKSREQNPGNGNNK